MISLLYKNYNKNFDTSAGLYYYFREVIFLSIKNKLYGVIGKAADLFSPTSQKDSEGEEKKEYSDSEMSAVCLKAAVESIVMLKNDGALPLKSNEGVAVFGRVQYDYFYVGYGSGGDINSPYKISPIQGFEKYGINYDKVLASKYKELCAKHPVSDGFWGHWPMCYDEVPLDESDIISASQRNEKAIIFIGRSSGEDRESTLTKGSWYLTSKEKKLLKTVTKHFKKVILLLNCGSITDMSEIEKLGSKISAILYVWQCGMESGNALGAVLSGQVSPSGKLSDTIARSYNDYPSSENFGGKKFNNYAEDIFVGYRYFETFAKDKLLYPFGFGLSYTSFEISDEQIAYTNGIFSFSAKVKNTGMFCGKEVVQVYCEMPSAACGEPNRVLCAYVKTPLLSPDESALVTGEFGEENITYFSSEKSAFVIGKGEYRFIIGTDCRSSKCVYTFVSESERVHHSCYITKGTDKPFKVLSVTEDGKESFKSFKPNCINQRERILGSIPVYAESSRSDISFGDVKSGCATLSDFVLTLSNDELEALSRGDFVMNSPLGATGNAGVFGGITQSLKSKGVPPVTTTDGPSGIRLCAVEALLPIGTALACTRNDELVEELYSLIAKNMKKSGTHMLLAPGMNIHRNPLCGRNFEYYSEDPLLTGKMAAAAVRGIQSTGLSACPKHFACNNQEYRRTRNDSRLSERALHEIYLRGFEICVKEGKPKSIMTSYNKVNGVWSHYNFDLVNGVLRGEWGYDGLVITDWWMQSSTSPEFPLLRNQAYRVRSGINVLMPGGARAGKYRSKPDGTLLESLGNPEGITKAELYRNAEQVLKFILMLDMD